MILLVLYFIVLIIYQYIWMTSNAEYKHAHILNNLLKILFTYILVLMLYKKSHN